MRGMNPERHTAERWRLTTSWVSVSPMRCSAHAHDRATGAGIQPERKSQGKQRTIQYSERHVNIRDQTTIKGVNTNHPNETSNRFRQSRNRSQAISRIRQRSNQTSYQSVKSNLQTNKGDKQTTKRMRYNTGRQETTRDKHKRQIF